MPYDNDYMDDKKQNIVEHETGLRLTILIAFVSIIASITVIALKYLSKP